MLKKILRDPFLISFIILIVLTILYVIKYPT